MLELRRDEAHFGGVSESVPSQAILEDAVSDEAVSGDTPACLLRSSPTYEMATRLPPDLLRASVALRDWLMGEARASRDPQLILAGLCERLNVMGVPVDRATSAIDTLHSEHAALGQFWVKGEAPRGEAFTYANDSRARYENSPFYAVHQTREMLELWLPDTPDARFGIVEGLKAGGYVHYLCYPIFFANGDENGITFTTRRASGFSEQDKLLIAFALPAVVTVLEITAGYLTLDQVLRIYVGDEPHKEILAGSVRRGQTSRIRSAILFADMRGYTRLSSDMAPEDIVALLNTYFDCLVPPIEAEGGEVLKYMGDGLLAIFRDKGDDMGGAAASALVAARAGLARLVEANAEGQFPVPIMAGIALHHGEAAYGNVGSGMRLDFTVVGRDINLASRLARMNKQLGEPLLMSGAFADHLWGAPTLLGRFILDGLAEDVAIYKPK
jgi:adenylate cyclase